MKLTMIDTHSHLQFSQYDDDREEVVRRALEKGIAVLNVGTDLKTSRKAIELSETYEGLYATAGLHPNDSLEEEYRQIDFEPLLAHSKVVAVGEIGLDYYRTRNISLREAQRTRFTKQLDLAVKNDLPVIIHCRDAHEDMLNILSLLSNIKGVIHSYTGTLEQVKRYMELGYYIGFNGIITFARDYDEIVKNVPMEKILLETDAPYLSPIPYRGKRNESSYLIEIAQKISELKNIEIDEVIHVSTYNALELFMKVNIGNR